MRELTVDCEYTTPKDDLRRGYKLWRNFPLAKSKSIILSIFCYLDDRVICEEDKA